MNSKTPNQNFANIEYNHGNNGRKKIDPFCMFFFATVGVGRDSFSLAATQSPEQTLAESKP